MTSGAAPAAGAPLWAAAPFVALLVSIAVGPLIAKRWWHRHYPKVVVALGAPVVAATLLGVAGGAAKVAHAAIEYVSFVALIGSLFAVTAGVVLRVRAAGTTAASVALLGFGGALANVVGTTGASMLLIRPFLRLNQGHVRARHVVFFVFIVSNVGGALTPIGDPPLFLGYLRGVPFFWTAETLFLPWVTAVGALLLVFAVIDAFEPRPRPARPEGAARFGVEVAGAGNLVHLAVILGLVLLQNEPWMKEHAPASTIAAAAAMLAVGAIALARADRGALRENDFSFEPIREVAILFAGIFATMIPALDWLQSNAATLGLGTPTSLYFACGSLSAFLDNAPTYLTFLTSEMARVGLDADDPEHVRRLLATPSGSLAVQAISCSAVFFGAMTYVGNGPNFMVKSIAEAAGAPCPSFAGYLLKGSLPILLPILGIVALVFFGGAR